MIYDVCLSFIYELNVSVIKKKIIMNEMKYT